MKKLTLGSLFDGIGGFPLAAQRCGIETLWGSEIEKNCIAITKRHFPGMAQLGSITEIDGGKIPPVDIISFGSPCQDLSVAGKQKGIDGERSGLFREAIRIIYEMRCATNGLYPTFILWENVPGAFNSNGGGDFRTVLEEITKSRISMPVSGKWAKAGMVRTCGIEVAWRQLDAQYWGVPQRRKRIFLVGDFGGQRAAEILFKCESLLGYSQTGRTEKADIAADFGKRAENASRNYRTGNSELQCVYELAHANEVIQQGKENLCPTLQARMGTGGNQMPMVLDIDPESIVLDDGGGKFIDIYTNGVCSTLRAQTKGHLPCVIGAYPISDAVISGGANGLGIGRNGDPAPTLTGRDRHSVAFFEEYRHGEYRETTGTLGTLRHSGGSCGPGSESIVLLPEERKTAGFSWFVSAGAGSTGYEEEKSPCIRATKPPAVIDTYTKHIKSGNIRFFIRYILRKLTPLECERLQGYLDEWTRAGDDGTEIKDTPRYVAIGNSLAVPCAERVFRGIVAVMGRKEE